MQKYKWSGKLVDYFTDSFQNESLEVNQQPDGSADYENVFERRKVKLMQELFACNFSNFLIPGTNPFRPQYGNLPGLIFRSSFNYSAQKLLRSTEALEQNIARCKHSKYKVIKTIRIEDFKKFWDLIHPASDIKVVHLIRDPRAVQSSRIRVGSSDSESKLLCDWPMRAIEFSQSNEISLKGKYFQMLFDKFAVDPVPKTKAMFSFLGMDFSEEMETLVRNLTQSKEQKSGGYKTESRNASLVARSWVSKLNSRDRNRIENDDVCKKLIRHIHGRSEELALVV